MIAQHFLGRRVLWQQGVFLSRLRLELPVVRDDRRTCPQCSILRTDRRAAAQPDRRDVLDHAPNLFFFLNATDVEVFKQPLAKEIKKFDFEAAEVNETLTGIWRPATSSIISATSCRSAELEPKNISPSASRG